MELVFSILLILVASICFVQRFLRRRELARMKAVSPAVEYPNNHHVLGVGYYHAACQVWYPQPWNEYREDRGYFWMGTWNKEPDQRMVAKSMPSVSEVERVNEEWRKADPDSSRQFWTAVEHEGFGTASRRSERS